VPLLLAALLLLPGLAFAQEGNSTAEEGGLSVPGDLSPEGAERLAALCSGEGSGESVDPRTVADVRGGLAIERTESTEGGVDREDAFNALAIHANNGEPVQYSDLQDQIVVRREARQGFLVPNFDEEDVFSALALGIHSDGISAVEALACAARIDIGAVEERITTDVTLEREDTLGAIALHNQGASLDWRDVADITRTDAQGVTWDHEFILTEEQVFRALSLGIGGRDANV